MTLQSPIPLLPFFRSERGDGEKGRERKVSPSSLCRTEEEGVGNPISSSPLPLSPSSPSLHSPTFQQSNSPSLRGNLVFFLMKKVLIWRIPPFSVGSHTREGILLCYIRRILQGRGKEISSHSFSTHVKESQNFLDWRKRDLSEHVSRSLVIH